MMYVYKRTEPNLWTVGFYHGDKWEPDSDHDSPSKAAKRVRYLNGGQDAAPELLAALQMVLELADTQCIFLEPDEEAQIKQALVRARSSEEVGA
jgi:hypothetical protein